MKSKLPLYIENNKLPSHSVVKRDNYGYVSILYLYHSKVIQNF